MEYAKRKNIRLPKYDYGQKGGYFLTVCTHEHRCTLSRIVLGTETERAYGVLTDFGKITDEVIRSLPERYGFSLDSYVVMPNHIHMILIKQDASAATAGELIGAIKSSAATRWYKECDRRGIIAGKLWQRNFYDHIIRNDADYLEKRKYIEENPDKWCQDKLYAQDK